jgi:mono/diheme cytochrome c family protein
MNPKGRCFNTGRQLISALLFGCAVLAGASKPTQLKPKEQLTPLIQSIKGPDLFRAYCASCHGLDAKGAGPTASILKTKVPDLTVLARNNRGQFPTLRVRQMIMGDQVVAAHGSREMPIWGPIFHQIEEDQDFGNVRLANLVKYLESIQSVATASSPSGAELYAVYCVACHGSDLKGSGPVPDPYRTPPDLTTLARRHGGKFPDGYVSEVLRNGVILPAHGPAEMPVWGEEFKARERLNAAQVTARIRGLTEYIKSLQVR